MPAKPARQRQPDRPGPHDDHRPPPPRTPQLRRRHERIGLHLVIRAAAEHPRSKPRPAPPRNRTKPLWRAAPQDAYPRPQHSRRPSHDEPPFRPENGRRRRPGQQHRPLADRPRRRHPHRRGLRRRVRGHLPPHRHGPLRKEVLLQDHLRQQQQPDRHVRQDARRPRHRQFRHRRRNGRRPDHPRRQRKTPGRNHRKTSPQPKIRLGRQPQDHPALRHRAKLPVPSPDLEQEQNQTPHLLARLLASPKSLRRGHQRPRPQPRHEQLRARRLRPHHGRQGHRRRRAPHGRRLGHAPSAAPLFRPGGRHLRRRRPLHGKQRSLDRPLLERPLRLLHQARPPDRS